MVGRASRRELSARNGDVVLAGTLWMPPRDAVAAVLMHPGSGPSDRDNDVYFPPIREHLLQRDIAVCSFDKRGVGGSTGRWQEAAIEEQAGDVLAALDALSGNEVDVPVGLFGHSQGGWVVVEAASRRPPIAFVVSNSGPGVTPLQQERFATRAHVRRAGIAPAEVDEVLRYIDRLAALMRGGVPFEDARSRIEESGFPEAFTTLGLPLLPDDAAQWQLMAAMLDYDPRPALERIDVPVLALFGADDAIVPVEDSVEVYRDAVRPELLTVAVLPGGGHRAQTGDPPRLVDGYLDALSSFVAAAVAGPRV
jgi:pimeloyl-ACP methyl ester carboxylesterase